MPFDLDDMISRTRWRKIAYFGKTVAFSYYVEKVTHEFRADVVRLMRMLNRLETKRQKLTKQLTDKPEGDELDDSDDDAATERAIMTLDADDELLKRKIDESLAAMIAEWDITKGGQPYPPTVENLYPIDGALEAAIVQSILEDATPLGEASGQGNVSLLPLSSKPKASALTRRATFSKRRHG